MDPNAAVNAFLENRTWRNESALSLYMNCLPTVALVCAKQDRPLRDELIYELTALELQCAHLKFWPMLCAYERRCGAASRDDPDVAQNTQNT